MDKLLGALWAWGMYREYKVAILKLFLLALVVWVIATPISWLFGIGAKHEVQIETVAVEWHRDDNRVNGGNKVATLRLTNTSDTYYQNIYIDCKTDRGFMNRVRFNDYSGLAAGVTEVRSYPIEDSAVYDLPSCWVGSFIKGKPSRITPSQEEIKAGGGYSEWGDRLSTVQASREAPVRPAKIAVHMNGIDTDIIDGKMIKLLSLFVVNEGVSVKAFDLTCANDQGTMAFDLYDGSGARTGEQSHHVYRIADKMQGPLTCSVTNVETGAPSTDPTLWGNRVDYEMDFE